MTKDNQPNDGIKRSKGKFNPVQETRQWAAAASEERCKRIARNTVRRLVEIIDIEKLLELPRQVEQGNNPFESIPWLQNFSKLIDAALALSEQSDVFNNRYFKPFIKAWRKEINAMGGKEFMWRGI